MEIIDWGSDVGTTGTGKYLKWGAKTRIRLCSPAIAYDHVWPTGTKREYVAAVMDLDDGNKLKVASLKVSMRKALKAFNEDSGSPHGPDAPYFVIHRESNKAKLEAWLCWRCLFDPSRSQSSATSSSDDSTDRMGASLSLTIACMSTSPPASGESSNVWKRSLASS